MNIGGIIMALRKEKGWSQSELAKVVGVSREIIGKYERNDTFPSIEIAKNIADALEVSLDYLVGTAKTQLNSATLKRLQEIDQLSEENKKLVYAFLDSFIIKTKLQNVLS